jgi:hypothetical protein
MSIATHADRVRELARLRYIDPARRRKELTVRIVAGEVQKAAGLTNRVSLVCQALKSKKFLTQNHLQLEKTEGPPSGMSTTVVFTYRLTSAAAQASVEPAGWPFLKLRGIGKDVFRSLGGGEAFIRKEREKFYGSGKDS